MKQLYVFPLIIIGMIFSGDYTISLKSGQNGFCSDTCFSYSSFIRFSSSETILIPLISVSAGTFNMGEAESRRESNYEGPLHAVTLESFFMSATEITQKQFTAVMNYNPSVFKDNADLPVENISWKEAANFCNRLSEKNGLEPCYNEKTWLCDTAKSGFRLPSEAEWEYACRANTSTFFHTGDTEKDLARAGWYRKNSGNKSQVVGKKEPNKWGLYDMHGNIWEMCNDWYGENYYSESPSVKPLGPQKGIKKVLRGGSWSHPPAACRAGDRWSVDPDGKFGNVGFRIVKKADSVPTKGKSKNII